MTVGGRVGALWIGGLEPYMDEAFLQVPFLSFIVKIQYPISCLDEIQVKQK